MNNRIFDVRDNRLVLRNSNQRVPEDEPVFILRARDKQALSTVRSYQSVMRPKSDDWKIIQDVIDDFTKFRQENPIKMGHPPDVY